MVGAVLDSLDGVLNEPDHALSLDNIPPDQRVQGFLSELLVTDVQLLILLYQELFQGSKEFEVLAYCSSLLDTFCFLKKERGDDPVLPWAKIWVCSVRFCLYFLVGCSFVLLPGSLVSLVL